MQPISICVIAKNEEKHMDTFLSRIVQHTKGYPMEIILADTGSTDATKEIASRYPVKIFDFPWINDFSAARNFSVSQASNDWILILDCDEYLEEFDMKSVQHFMLAYPKYMGAICIRSYFTKGRYESVSNDYIDRLFDRRYYHFTAIVHEHLEPLDGSSELNRFVIPISARHSGYDLTEEELKKKAARNNPLLLQMLKENPNDPYLYYQLGQGANFVNDAETACKYYAKALEFNVDPRAIYVRNMVVSYGYALLELKRYDEALLFENIYDDFDSSADFVFLMGLIYLRTGNYLKAMAEFLKATTFETAQVDGANSYLAYYNMGAINEVLGNTRDAVALYQKCGDFSLAQERLTLLVPSKDTPTTEQEDTHES